MDRSTREGPTTERLTPDEDAALRRLHLFEGLGVVLTDDYATVKQALLERDRRERVRPPFDDVEPLDVRTLQRALACVPQQRVPVDRSCRAAPGRGTMGG